MFLEVDQRISCRDLEFAHTTWRSSQQSFVGLYPRLLTLQPGNGKAMSYSVSGPFWVWWYRAYSFMLPYGVIINRNMLWKVVILSMFLLLFVPYILLFLNARLLLLFFAFRMDKKTWIPMKRISDQYLISILNVFRLLCLCILPWLSLHHTVSV